MFTTPGAGELLIIFSAIVLLFGADKLPKLGGAIGESIKNFKKGVRSEPPPPSSSSPSVKNPSSSSSPDSP